MIITKASHSFGAGICLGFLLSEPPQKTKLAQNKFHLRRNLKLVEGGDINESKVKTKARNNKINELYTILPLLTKPPWCLCASLPYSNFLSGSKLCPVCSGLYKSLPLCSLATYSPPYLHTLSNFLCFLCYLLHLCRWLHQLLVQQM